MGSNQCQTYHHDNEGSASDHWAGGTGWAGLRLPGLIHATVVHVCALLHLFSVPLVCGVFWLAFLVMVGH